MLYSWNNSTPEPKEIKRYGLEYIQRFAHKFTKTKEEARIENIEFIRMIFIVFAIFGHFGDCRCGAIGEVKGYRLSDFQGQKDTDEGVSAFIKLVFQNKKLYEDNSNNITEDRIKRQHRHVEHVYNEDRMKFDIAYEMLIMSFDGMQCFYYKSLDYPNMAQWIQEEEKYNQTLKNNQIAKIVVFLVVLLLIVVIIIIVIKKLSKSKSKSS